MWIMCRIKEKIDKLRGVAVAVEGFFNDRRCEDDWHECARVLVLHAMDARGLGLYDSAEFAEERLVTPGIAEYRATALKLKDIFVKDVFVDLSSMMRRTRRESVGDDYPGESRVQDFQQYLLEDIEREIKTAEGRMS